VMQHVRCDECCTRHRRCYLPFQLQRVLGRCTKSRSLAAFGRQCVAEGHVETGSCCSRCSSRVALRSVSKSTFAQLLLCHSLFVSQAYLAMSPNTDVQVEAARVIAYIAVHPEGRLHITELLVHTLQRLLDARALPVRAVATLVVARHSYSSWEPNSPEGKQLLKACCEIAQQIPDASSRDSSADQDENAASFEHAAEALSVLCMRYEAKVRASVQLHGACHCATSLFTDACFNCSCAWT